MAGKKDKRETNRKLSIRLDKMQEQLEHMTIVLEAHQRLLLAIHLALSEGGEKMPVFMPERFGI